MIPASCRLVLGGVLMAALAATALAQERQVYRYTDKEGRVVYSDRAPPADSKDIQAKRIGPNYIETSELPLAARQAAERFPVTLYTFACGDICQSAEGLLNRRGVPFASVNIEDPKGNEQLKQLTGDLQAPVLQIGDKTIVKGFNDARWQAALDEAGYPKAPPTRRTQPLATPAPEAPPRAAPPAAPAAPVPAPAGGYPRQ